METTSTFRVSMGLGEELGPSAGRGSQPCTPGLPWDHSSASSTRDPKSCLAVPAGAVPWLHSGPAVAAAPTCPWVSPSIPGCPWVSPHSHSALHWCVTAAQRSPWRRAGGSGCGSPSPMPRSEEELNISGCSFRCGVRVKHNVRALLLSLLPIKPCLLV